MDKEEVRRLIEHARSIGLDAVAVLGWRLNFEREPHIRRVQRPKGMLSMGDVVKKYSIGMAYLWQLRPQKPILSWLTK
jgi:hypothetical protein